MYDLNTIKRLTNDYGSPLYVFRVDDFIENYRIFEESFKSRYPKYKIAYSYKTNYTPEICRIIKDMGGYAEVVSDMELMAAVRLGYENDRIIYNGPYKGRKGIEHFMKGGILHVDHLHELTKLCDLAENNPHMQFTIGFRLNIDIGQNFISRFGLDVENGDLQKAFDMVSEVGNLHVIGLHCHIGQSRTIEAWKNRVRIMLAYADRYFEKPPRYIDLGSGMFARMNPALAEQFGAHIPSFEDYADAVAKAFHEHYKAFPMEDKPVLFTEPGTTLINSYVDFIGKAECIKRIKGREFVVFNCSKDNIGDICRIKNLPITVVPGGEPECECKEADFVGYTCLEHDVMYKGFQGRIAPEDYVVFENVGGYSNVSKPPFISENCAMVALKRDGEARVMKYRENFDDIFRTYVF